MSAETILSRIHKAKRTSNNSWLACCPAHEDKSPSLTITEKSDGRILLHCFAGCDTDSVLGAIGLEMTDLFPEQITHHAPPERVKVYPRDALGAIRQEAQLVMLAAFELAKNKPLPAEDLARLKLAMARINTALELTGE